jgi:hypothetical protein
MALALKIALFVWTGAVAMLLLFVSGWMGGPLWRVLQPSSYDNSATFVELWAVISVPYVVISTLLFRQRARRLGRAEA